MKKGTIVNKDKVIKWEMSEKGSLTWEEKENSENIKEAPLSDFDKVMKKIVEYSPKKK
jgi:hypothetical protein